MFEHVLVPVDGSEHAACAIDIAGDLVAHYGAKLTLIHALTRAGGDRVPKGLRVLREDRAHEGHRARRGLRRAADQLYATIQAFALRLFHDREFKRDAA